MMTDRWFSETFLGCFLVLVALAVPRVAASPVEIRIQPILVAPADATPGDAVKGRLLASPSGELGAEDPARIELPFAAGKTLSVALDPGRTWRLEARAEGYWSPEAIVVPTAGQPPTVLRLHPTGFSTCGFGRPVSSPIIFGTWSLESARGWSSASSSSSGPSR